MRYSVPVAYALWFISGFGVAGFHRFYLGKTGTGVLWLLTGGLAGFGAIYDLITLPRQVREANLEHDVRVAIAMGSANILDAQPRAAPRAESTETVILRLAKSNGGGVTPGEVAIEGGIPVEQARKELDRLAASGTAELRVRSSGVVVYFFPEFSGDKSDYVDLG